MKGQSVREFAAEVAASAARDGMAVPTRISVEPAMAVAGFIDTREKVPSAEAPGQLIDIPIRRAGPFGTRWRRRDDVTLPALEAENPVPARPPVPHVLMRRVALSLEAGVMDILQNSDNPEDERAKRYLSPNESGDHRDSPTKRNAPIKLVVMRSEAIIVCGLVGVFVGMFYETHPASSTQNCADTQIFWVH